MDQRITDLKYIVDALVDYPMYLTFMLIQIPLTWALEMLRRPGRLW